MSTKKMTFIQPKQSIDKILDEYELERLIEQETEPVNHHNRKIEKASDGYLHRVFTIA